MPRAESATAVPPADPRYPIAPPGHPMVVFDDHRFCAGVTLEVQRMPAPHMHSQIELNFLLEGALTYWFDGRRLSLSAGQLALFWGMVPHQTVWVEEGTRFVCLYVPVSVFLSLPISSRFRSAVFDGAIVEVPDVQRFEADMFLRWRSELLSGDEQRERIVREELGARLRRIDLDGWRDLRRAEAVALGGRQFEHGRELHVERIARYIGENGCDQLSVAQLAALVGLHPNYAMRLFKRALGMTINQAITRHRLDTAQALLISTDKSIADIAFDSGFGSLSRFYEAFHARFAASPRSFRRRYR